MEEFFHWSTQIVNRYPNAEIISGRAHVAFKPLAGGFPMRLDLLDPQRPRLSMGGWSDDSYSIQAAGALICAALAGRLRLRNTYDQGELLDVAIEVRARPNDWIEIAATSSPLFPRIFSRSFKRTQYVQY